MSMYLIPKSPSLPDDLAEITSRNKIPLIEADIARDVITADDASRVSVYAVDDATLHTLARNADQLLIELPVIITAVPDVPYMGAWRTTATMFPSVSFREWKELFRKSGAVANTTSDLRSMSGIDYQVDDTEDDDPTEL